MFGESASAIPSMWESMNSWFTPTVLFVLVNVVVGTIVFTSTFTNQKRNQNQQQTESQTDTQRQNVARSPSVLQRLKSINFYRSQDASQKSVTDSDNLFNLESSHEAQNFEAQAQYFFQPSHQESSQENHETALAQMHYILQQDLQETQAHLIFEEGKATHLDFLEVNEQKAEQNELRSMDEVYSEVTGSDFIRSKPDTEPASGEIPVKLPARMRKSTSLKSAFGHFVEENIVEARRPATMREKGNSKFPEDHEVDAKADDFINKFKNQLKLQRLDSIIRYKDMIGRGTKK
ncbi:uncharacterized protein LOC111385266 [Olea europaea var. sylvestris]|uniref:DUF4408 domain-containing protein n=1 Tax=Olea europaea subsp. europaea TaxID=158383 RepID=A0A8S0Q094_OLEEU|nr:uncharacterized protein LOC111385266 [Olea europaea var. sylvestris]CAA2959581.1 Hypothetical predicted protein [Olea europaea subsp. europaea]